MPSLFPAESLQKGVRPAILPDIESIYWIYTPFIEHTAITFETEVPSLESFISRMQKVMQDYVLLVYENQDGDIEGYAYFNAYRERKAYRWCVESSVYVKEHHFGKGIAVLLYTRLIEVAKASGFRRMYGAISTPNPRSEAFHQKMGFTRFAVFEKTGFKFDRWWDVSWYELVLNDSETIPSEPVISLY